MEPYYLEMDSVFVGLSWGSFDLSFLLVETLVYLTILAKASPVSTLIACRN
jgi:hypothetical protein